MIPAVRHCAQFLFLFLALSVSAIVQTQRLFGFDHYVYSEKTSSLKSQDLKLALRDRRPLSRKKRSDNIMVDSIVSLTTNITGLTAVIESPHNYMENMNYVSTLVAFQSISTYYLHFDFQTSTEKSGDPITVRDGSQTGSKVLYMNTGIVWPSNIAVSSTSGIIVELNSDASLTRWGLLVTVGTVPFLSPPIDEQEALSLCSVSKDFDLSGIGWICNSTGQPVDDPCNYWSNMRCDDDGRIVAVDLAGLGVVSSKSDTFSQFARLQYLDLSANRLTSSLPSSWSSLTNLQYLCLYNNSLNGSLPSSWSSLINLQELYLYSNVLSGSLASTWSSLTSLQYLFLDRNTLHGSLPSSWSSLTNLQYLFLDRNTLHGSLPSSWSSFTNLRYLYLYSNAFNGPLPSSWGNLTCLQAIHLYNNSLSGSLPSSWSSLTNLHALHLYSNALHGSLPSSWSSLTSLQYLYLASNAFNGPLPSSWGNLTYLQELDLSYNMLSGALPSAICDMPSLVSLQGRHNHFSCYSVCPTKFLAMYLDFDSLVHCPGLQDAIMCELESSLGVSNTMATLEVRKTVVIESPHFVLEDEYALTYTQHILLNGVSYIDVGDAVLVSYPKAIRYEVSMDWLTEWYTVIFFDADMKDLGQFGNCDRDKYPGGPNPPLVIESENGFYFAVGHENTKYVDSGTDFTYWGAFTSNIFGFRLSVTYDTRGVGWKCAHNAEGQPTAVGLCETQKSGYTQDLEWTGITCTRQSTVSSIDLAALGLAGSIPSSITSIPNLRFFKMPYNYLSGELPLDLWSMGSLESIDITSNLLTGLLPTTITSPLHSILTANNQLSGSIPSFLAELQNLKTLRLDGNEFSGDLPTAFCDTEILQLSVSNNPDVCYPQCWTAGHPLDVCPPGPPAASVPEIWKIVLVGLAAAVAFPLAALLYYIRRSSLKRVPMWDVFISYRSNSDTGLAEQLYGRLTARRLKVYMDKFCLEPGIPWERGFCNGLVNSRVFLPILSRNAVNKDSDSKQNFSLLRKDSACDNVLLEYRLALELNDRRLIERVFPLLAGEYSSPPSSPNSDKVYWDYFECGCHPKLNGDVVVNAVEEKLREHLQASSLGEPLRSEESVRGVLARLTAFQGYIFKGPQEVCITNVEEKLVKMIKLVDSSFDSCVRYVCGVIFGAGARCVDTAADPTMSPLTSHHHDIKDPTVFLVGAVGVSTGLSTAGAV